MHEKLNGRASRPRGILAGAAAWLISDGRAGMVVQCRGVADALGVDYQSKIVAPRGIWKLMAPWGPVAPAERPDVPGSPFAQPWPDIAIASGRASIPYVRALRRASKGRTYTVVLQDPRSGPDTADLIWVPQHDKRRGANVITSLTSPHSHTPERIAARRKQLPADILALPQPRVAVILGGKNGSYAFTDGDDQRFQSGLESIGRLGASFMVTPSRRTHPELREAADAATGPFPRIFWDGEGPNPYADFLAAADWLVVTADSVNMTGECCATGRPVYVFEPSGRSGKFGRFHEALRTQGMTRLLPPVLQQLEHWSYPPIDSAAEIAAEIERRYVARQQSGRMTDQTPC